MGGPNKLRGRVEKNQKINKHQGTTRKILFAFSKFAYCLSSQTFCLLMDFTTTSEGHHSSLIEGKNERDGG